MFPTHSVMWSFHWLWPSEVFVCPWSNRQYLSIIKFLGCHIYSNSASQCVNLLLFDLFVILKHDFQTHPTIFVPLGSSSKLVKFAAVLVRILNRLLDILPRTLQFAEKVAFKRKLGWKKQQFVFADRLVLLVQSWWWKFYWQWIRKWGGSAMVRVFDMWQGWMKIKVR